MEVTAKIRDRDIQNLMYQLDDKRARRAMAMGVNKAARSVRGELVKRIAKAIQPQREGRALIRKDFRIQGKATKDRLLTMVEARGGRIPLRYFQRREVSSTGTLVKIGGSQHLYKGGFIRGGKFPKRTPLSFGGGAVFRRTGTYKITSTARGEKWVSDFTGAKGVSIAGAYRFHKLDRYVEQEVPKIVKSKVIEALNYTKLL